MIASDLFHAQVEDDVFVVTLQNQVTRMAESIVMSERQLLSAEFSRSASAHAVIDFHELSYFTSLLLEALLQLWKVVEAGDGRMAICNLFPIGREIIAASHFDSLWPVCDTREQAVQAVLAASRSE